MGDSKLYSTHDIEKLKQKIATYKDTLNTLKTGSSIDGYLFIKNEFNDFKTQISHLEGLTEIMDEKQSRQIEEYEQQVEKFEVQINTLNQTIEELNQDISLIMNKLSNGDSSDLLEEINTSVGLQDSLNNTHLNDESEVNHTTEEITQTKDQASLPSIRQSNLPPSFQQIQKFVNEAKSIQEVPANMAPPENIATQKKFTEGPQDFNKQSFPSNTVNPRQTSNGQYKNGNTKSVITINTSSKKQTFPMTVNKTRSIPLTDGYLEKEKILTEYIDDTQNTAPIDVKQESIVAPIEVKQEIIVAPIEVKQETIEISNETEQQENFKKETLSFLKFFRKKS
jgi:hypothetical protein